MPGNPADAGRGAGRRGGKVRGRFAGEKRPTGGSPRPGGSGCAERNKGGPRFGTALFKNRLHQFHGYGIGHMEPLIGQTQKIAL